MIGKTSYKIIGLILPIALLATTFIAFSLFGKHYGAKTAYFFGFMSYWIVWCIGMPLLFMTFKEIKSFFKFNISLFIKSKFINLICLIAPLIFAYAYVFPAALQSASFDIIIVSAALALINGTLEELLWRGLYLKFFKSNKWLYIIYASLGFAIWHFAPQLIFPNKAPGGQMSFVSFAFVLGIIFSIVSYNTKSILLVTICHILFDFSGLGGRLYF